MSVRIETHPGNVKTDAAYLISNSSINQSGQVYWNMTNQLSVYAFKTTLGLFLYVPNEEQINVKQCLYEYVILLHEV